jgi:putative NADPH-quinone reductase
MVVSVILEHPETGSFNHAIAQTAVTALEAAGHQVRFHDLCAEGFEALLPAGEAGRAAAADRGPGGATGPAEESDPSGGHSHRNEARKGICG